MIITTTDLLGMLRTVVTTSGISSPGTLLIYTATQRSVTAAFMPTLGISVGAIYNTSSEWVTETVLKTFYPLAMIAFNVANQ